MDMKSAGRVGTDGDVGSLEKIGHVCVRWETEEALGIRGVDGCREQKAGPTFRKERLLDHPV